MSIAIANMEQRELPDENRPRPTRTHFPFIDGVRGFAALCVMAVHSLFHVPMPREFRLFNLVPFGRMAVDVFIVTSGFCLMLPALRNGLHLKGGVQTFLLRRARRILPPYYAAVLMSLLLIATLIGHPTGTHWDTSLPVTIKGLIAHLLLIQNVWGGSNSASQINHVLWTIAVEWQIYFLFPFILWAWRRCRSGYTPLACLLLGIAAYAATYGTKLQGLTPQFFGLFALGMWSAERAFYGLSQRSVPLTILFMGTAIVLYALFPERSIQYIGVIDLSCGIGAAALLIALATGRFPAMRRALEMQALVRCGLFSYSLYLVHAPLIALIWQYGCLRVPGTDTWHMLLLAVVGWPLILFCAFQFYRLCERPFLNARRDPPVEDEFRMKLT